MSNRRNYILYIVIGILVCGVIYLYNQNNNLQTEQVVLQAELAHTNTQLVNKDNIITEQDKAIISFENSIEYLNEELLLIEDELLEADRQLTDKDNIISEFNDNLNRHKDILNGLNITVKGTKECTDVELIDNPKAKNSTLNEVLAFLKKDITEYNQYVEDVYDCSQFSRDIHNNAEAAGIKCAEIQISFTNLYYNHALNAFITTDYGLVFVDCTEEPDTIAFVKTGKYYRLVEIKDLELESINDDDWWYSLDDYYYIKAQTAPGIVYLGIVEAKTSEITIYW